MTVNFFITLNIEEKNIELLFKGGYEKYLSNL